ncbi:hypothetical protein B0H10DRAFT_2207415 [Mycena sp. CBHHK59/15]|nr:hypothetical protein B0H10DRAFT_2207415 [Mycena sp. CBHHK59/15]
MLFHGIACFSPSVHASLRSAWVKHGGALTHTKQDFFRATVFFCAGPTIRPLSSVLSIATLSTRVTGPFRLYQVRHARWIAKSVAEQFPVPVSKYLLDGDIFRAHEEHAATKLTLKRALNSENHDDSLTEIIQRPTKRARIQPATPARVQAPPPPTNPSPLPLPSFLPPPAASFLPLPATSLIPPRPTRARFYPSPANLTPSPALPAVPLKRIDFTALRPSSAVPTVHGRSGITFSAPPLPPDAPMRTSAAALLQMPAVDACAFVVGATFRGKAFACAKVPGRYRRPAGAA